jgi:hypothetical protein
MENLESILLIGFGVFILARAIWLSLAKRRHIAWISALALPLLLVGWLTSAAWVYILAFLFFAVGEYLYQTNDELSPADFEELREDLQTGSRRRRTRTRSRGDTPPRHSNEDPSSGGQN